MSLEVWGQATHLFDVPGDDVHGDLGEGLFLEPVGITVGFPFAEVFGIDGPAIEVAGQDGLDFGQAVEPGDETDAGDTVLDGTGELAADFVGQTPDFTDMRAYF